MKGTSDLLELLKSQMSVNVLHCYVAFNIMGRGGMRTGLVVGKLCVSGSVSNFDSGRGSVFHVGKYSVWVLPESGCEQEWRMAELSIEHTTEDITGFDSFGQVMSRWAC